nr:pentatricopeptide repeat-containing protein At5g09450, mitochondrial [Ipomoea batatas]
MTTRTLPMAARSIFLALTRNARGRERVLGRSFSIPTIEIVCDDSPDFAAEETGESLEEDDLKARIFRLRLPKRSATHVVQRWVDEGRRITAADLRHISKELRMSRRYKHALEISEWMVSNNKDEILDLDYAIRIDLMTKVFGIDAAERYFEALPDAAKTTETYTALLHSYASSRLTDKAEDLYERMKEANLSLSTLTYNELLTLYMSVGQLEKVSLVIEEMKHQKVAPDIFTYNLWISSCAAAFNIDAVRQILDEMSLDSGSDECWTRYANLVRIYISSGQLVNSETNSLVETEKGITQREWITYDFLIILYGGLGNKEKLDQIWKSLTMTKQKMTSRNYVCIVSSYLMLGHIREVREIVEQWKQSGTVEFDRSSCNRLLEAYSDIGLKEKAVNFHTVLLEKIPDLRHKNY